MSGTVHSSKELRLYNDNMVLQPDTFTINKKDLFEELEKYSHHFYRKYHKEKVVIICKTE